MLDKNLFKIGYPLSNLGYMQDVNQWVMDNNPEATTTEVDDLTKEVLEKATLFNNQNKDLRAPQLTGAYSFSEW